MSFAAALLEMGRDFFQIPNDGQMLRTGALALAAGDAVAGLAEHLCEVGIVLSLGRPLLLRDLLLVGII